MSKTLDLIRPLVIRREIRVSDHGLRELSADDLRLDAIAYGISGAVVVEDYPSYHKGPSVLVLQRDAGGAPIHVLWGMQAGTRFPAVPITAYRPNPDRWSEDF